MALSQKVFHFGSNFQKIKSISCAYSLYVDSAQESDLTSILEILAKVNSEINSLLECFYFGNLSGLFLFMKLFERMTLTMFYLLIQFVHGLQIAESHTKEVLPYYCFTLILNISSSLKLKVA